MKNSGAYFRLESSSKHRSIAFEALLERLLFHVNKRIQNGYFTERGLARILGISQPQIHNVLKGKRKLQPTLADRMMRELELTILSLFEEHELKEQLSRLETQELVRKPAGREYAKTYRSVFRSESSALF